MRNRVSSKEKILLAAEIIIRDEGLEACTSRRISKEAEVALGTIYNYYNSRIELLEALFIKSWKNTRNLLAEILESKLNTPDKALKMLQTISEDVTSRNGLGDYLFNINNRKFEDIKSSYDFFQEIVIILVTLLRECPTNQNDTEQELEVIAQWIIFGHINFLKRDLNIDLYYRQVVRRFFT